MVSKIRWLVKQSLLCGSTTFFPNIFLTIEFMACYDWLYFMSEQNNTRTAGNRESKIEWAFILSRGQAGRAAIEKK